MTSTPRTDKWTGLNYCASMLIETSRALEIELAETKAALSELRLSEQDKFEAKELEREIFGRD